MEQQIRETVKLTHHASPGTPVYNALVRHLKRLLDAQAVELISLDRVEFEGRVRAQAVEEPEWLVWHGKTPWTYPLNEGVRIQYQRRNGEVSMTEYPHRVSGWQHTDQFVRSSHIIAYRIWKV